MQVAALPIPFHCAANNRPPPRRPRPRRRLTAHPAPTPDATATPTPVMPPQPRRPLRRCPSHRNARRRLGFAAPAKAGTYPNRPACEGSISPLPPSERLALDIPARGA